MCVHLRPGNDALDPYPCTDDLVPRLRTMYRQTVAKSVSYPAVLYETTAKWETASLLGKIVKCGRVGRDLLAHHKCAGEWDL